MPTGVGAALNTAGVRAGSAVAVFGCGGIGVNVIQGARLARASRIVAVDIVPRKLAWAREFGATDTLDAREGDVAERIKELTGGSGVDYALEAAGRTDTLEQALRGLALGGTCVIVGFQAVGAHLDLAVNAFYWAAGTLRVSWYGDCVPSRDFPLLCDWYLRGDLKLDELVTRVIGLDDTATAFRAMQDGDALRSVIKPGS